MPRRFRPSVALLAGLAAAPWPGRATSAPPAVVRPAAFAPLSGVVRADGRPLPGATLVVRGVTEGGATFLRLIRSEPDGTFVLADAAEGLYTILSVVPGFRPAVARLFHKPSAEGALSFIRIDLERPTGVLPEAEGGALDAWSARAVASGDVLRDVPAILAAVDATPAPPGATLTASARTPRAAVPLHAAMASTAGFGAAGASSLSRASLEVSGAVGERVRWGASGQYARLADGAGERTGDAARIAVDVSAGATQSLRISTRQQSLTQETDPTRFAAHALDWSGSVSEGAQAALSARVISQSHLLATGPAADLFARASDAVDVAARYQTALGATTFARVTVGYRTTSGEYAGASAPFARETRAGGVAGLRLGRLVVEAGATGDASVYGRGVTPELTVAVDAGDGWRVYGFASRRFESLSETFAERPGEAGADEADLSRRSRSLYRGGVAWKGPEGAGVALDVSRRELSGTYRLLFDADFLDRLDSLYFFPGDVATDAALMVSLRLGRQFDGRVALRAGALSGARDGAVQSDEAAWGVAQAALRVRASDTSVGVGYRAVAQTLARGGASLRNDIQAVDLTLAQGLPFPVLRSIGTDWRALFSFEFGRRREGEDAERTDRRLAGGLALSF